MTISGYLMVMIQVGIADLKAKMSQHLRTVRRGHPVIVMDRAWPIARIAPYESEEILPVRKPLPDAPALQDVALPPSLDLDFDIVDLLIEERQVDR